MYEIHYKQIDPDTGRIIREEKMATCESLRMANWIKNSLVEGDHDPNREYILIQPDKLSLDQIMREHASTERWEIAVLEDNEDHLIVMAPNGDTQYMTKKEYEQFKKNRNNGRSN